MPAALYAKLKTLTALDYIEGDGLSETMAATHANPPHRPKQQCLGIPTLDVDAQIIDPKTLRELPPGEAGEIVVHGAQVMQAYWRQPEATRQCFIEIDSNRFFRTGDPGRVDDEGYFFKTDRLKRMISASGFKVWPAEVESIMYQHPAALEVCVIGARDPRRGETVKAFIILRPEHRGQVADTDVIAWCQEHMAAYKVPRIVEFVETLPKSASGKAMWRELQEQQDQRDRERDPC
jgi:fatty-acyl-CoA synthase